MAATTALVMGGSGLGNPVVTTDAGISIPIPNYLPNVEKYYIAPNSTCQPSTCRLVPVITPEGLLPPIIGPITYDQSVAEGVTDLATALQTQLASHPRDQVVIFGYSQSGDIITKTKRTFADNPSGAPSTSQVSFVVAGNTNRPNGGILARFPGVHIPGLNITFDGAAPTDTGYRTTDIAFEYDPVADFPEYPINLLADINSLAGALGVHATYPNPYLPIPPGVPFFPTALPDGYSPAELQQAMSDPANRQTTGDTTYITIPTKNLPLLQPLLDIGADTHTSFVIKPIVDLVQPTLRVLVDLGYDRTTPYGVPTPARLLPTIDPGTLAAHLAQAVGQGVRQALTDVGVPTGATRKAKTPITSAVSVTSASVASAAPDAPARASAVSAASGPPATAESANATAHKTTHRALVAAKAGDPPTPSTRTSRPHRCAHADSAKHTQRLPATPRASSTDGTYTAGASKHAKDR
ncbi:hypothetical protein MMAD_19170 [Mycolicibacterium madagascariense]|uniref:PE-PPE domain-containing protein n=2 Tax=Mycolicibacterium madagascariense TaxID=212765 RepID=A0A7I7XDP2_9MYCO|nr:hypothetical protein MMAD_19170 [Mycolicibacterium madagascariense]